MSTTTPGDYVALLVPIYLRPIRNRLLDKARSQEAAVRQGWKSVAQANWLGEFAAQASHVPEIQQFLKAQGTRKGDHPESKALRDQISQDIGQPLRNDIVRAFTVANKKASQSIGPQVTLPPATDAEIDQAQLDLARVYINMLVALRRIDPPKEKE